MNKTGYEINKLIMMQKLEPTTMDLKLTKIVHMNRVIVSLT